MKTSNRIATLLIVLALGIITTPRVQAVIYYSDSIQPQEEPHKKQNFTGFIIDAYPADQLLLSENKVDMFHVHLTSTATENKTEQGQALIGNSYLNNCCKSQPVNSLLVNKNKASGNNLSKPKK